MSHQQGVSYNTYCLKRESIMAGSGSDLPDAFDVIVVGTGLEESMVAAAASRSGYQPNHLLKAFYNQGFTIKDYYLNIQHSRDLENSLRVGIRGP